jgi:ATPase family associated with various cellular activities (AAA)
VALCGADRHTLIALGSVATERAGLRPHLLRAADLPDEPDERRMLARLWEREARLGPNALLIDLGDDGRVLERATAFANALVTPALLLSEQPLSLATLRPLLRHTLAAPRAAEQQRIWAQALGPHTAALNGVLPRLAAQFSLPPAAIHAAAVEALAESAATDADELARRLWDACRQQARPRLDDLAQRITTRHGWDDIVLPERQLEMLHEVTAHVAQRRQVYELWGFGAEVRGTGTSVIFAGGSGTGKTLAAEILANELRLDLYRVDLSGVVSKYIGETEKNLRRIFSAAEYGGAILLFDEADALFGKRSEVRDSHDRYANIEVSYLLQQMESYCGLAILTTNMLDNFDRAFLRRVRFVVQFPFPTLDQRAAIWQRTFPAGAQTHKLDVSKLAPECDRRQHPQHCAQRCLSGGP